MTPDPFVASPLGGLPAAAVPAAFALGALATAACRSLPAMAWRLAETAAAAAIAAALATAAHAGVVAGAPTTLPQATLLVFVAFLGLVLVRYSRSYLAGERNEVGFAG